MATLKSVNDKYFHVEEWEYHRRGKNYIAKIVGKHNVYKFEREFMNYTRIDGLACFEKSDFETGEIYEVKCTYRTGSGHTSVLLHEFLEWDGTRFSKELTETEVLARLEGTEDNEAKLARLQDRKEQLLAELAKAEAEIENLK